MFRNSLVLLFLISMTAFLAVGCSSPSDPVDLTYGGNAQDDIEDPYVPLVAEGVDVGDEAPDFTLQDTYGDDVVLSDLRGKSVLLFFWATGCQYCEVQYPVMQDYHSTYGDSLTVVSVNLGDDPNLINAFMGERDLTFPCLVATSAMQAAFEITAVPHAILLDAEGIVEFNEHPGYLTEVMLQNSF